MILNEDQYIVYGWVLSPPELNAAKNCYEFCLMTIYRRFQSVRVKAELFEQIDNFPLPDTASGTYLLCIAGDLDAPEEEACWIEADDITLYNRTQTAA